MCNTEELIMKLTEKVDNAICCGVVAIIVSVLCLTILLLYMIKKGDI